MLRLVFLAMYVPFSVFIYLHACAEGHDKLTSHCRIYVAACFNTLLWSVLLQTAS